MMADSELSRTHPLTVAVRTISQVGQAFAAFLFLGFIGITRDGGLAFVGLAGLLILSSLVVAGFTWLNWAFFRYGIVGDDLLITEGWLVQKQRSIPIARVQGVDVRANLVSRIFGLADVMIQTAGGGTGKAEARIGSVPLSEAESLRSTLIAGRHQTPAPAGAVATAAEAHATVPIVGADPIGRLSDFRGALGGAQPPEAIPLAEYHASLPQLVVAALTSNAPLIAVAATVGLGSQLFEIAGSRGTDTAGAWFAAASIPLLVLSAVAAFLVVGAVAIAVTVTRDFGFTVSRTSDRLETEAGLLERRMTSVPVRRIQAVLVEATWPRRLFGLRSVRVNTAGFGRSENQQSTTSSALVPIARIAEARDLLARLLPEAAVFPRTAPLPRRALRFYILLPTLGTAVIALVLTAGPLTAFAALETSAAWAAVTPLIVALTVTILSAVVAGARALAWHSSAYGVSGDALAIDYGVVGSYQVRLGRSRIQSLTISQSPFQRRAGLATLHVLSVSGSSAARFQVRHMPADDAARIERWYSPDAPRQDSS